MKQAVPARLMTMHPPRPEAVGLTSYAAFLVLAAGVTGLLIRWKPAPILGAIYFTQSYWYIVGFKLILMLGVPLTWFVSSGYSFRELQPKWNLTARAAVWCLVAFLAGFFLNSSYLPQIKAALHSGKFPDAGLRIALGVVVPLVSAGIPEEFYFRGLLQTRLEAVGGRIFAILLSVALFTAWHLPSRYLLATGTEGFAGNFWSVLAGTGGPVFLVGLILALLYDRYRALVPLIVLHCGIDLLPHTASFFGINH